MNKEENPEVFLGMIVKLIISLKDSLTPEHISYFFKSLSILFYPKVSKKSFPEETLILALNTVSLAMSKFTIHKANSSSTEIDMELFSEARVLEGYKVTAVINLAIKVLKAWQKNRGLKTHKAGTLRSPLFDDNDFSSDEEKKSHIDQFTVFADSQVCMVGSCELFESIPSRKKQSKKSLDEVSPEVKVFVLSCLQLALQDLALIEKAVGDMLFQSEVGFLY